jgi:methylated-DNA-protein-cysteine methyltransferase-like protein
MPQRSGRGRKAGEPVSVYERIHAVARLVPRGRVATYGQIARIVGCTPRMVGYAMASLPDDSDVPWQRVINSQGRVSPRGAGDGGLIQRKILEREGIRFDASGRVDLERVGWEGPE